MKFIYRALISIVIILFSKDLIANEKMALLEAVSKNLVSFTVEKSPQAYNEKGLTMKLNNKSSKQLIIIIDPALIFGAADSSYQNLIILGNEIVNIAPKQTKNVLIQTYCGNSDKLAPDKNIQYSYKYQADSNLIKTLIFIKKNQVSNTLAQSAVWFFTDSFPNLNDIYQYSQQEKSKLLVTFICDLLHVPYPEYFFEKSIETTPHQVVSSPVILQLSVDIKWEQANKTLLSLSIFNDKNAKIESYFELKEMKAGRYELHASFKTSAYPKGNYTVRLYNNKNETIKEIKVPLK